MNKTSTAPVGEELARLRAQAQADILSLRERTDQLDADSLDLIITGARSHYAWTDRPVSEEQIRTIYDIVKTGATSMNGSPARFVFVRTDEGKDRLEQSLKHANVEINASYILDPGYKLGKEKYGVRRPTGYYAAPGELIKIYFL